MKGVGGGALVYRALFEGLESEGFLMSRRDERKARPDISISTSGVAERGSGMRGVERMSRRRGARSK